LAAVSDDIVRVAVPEPPEMLGGLIVAVRPGDALKVRVTVPVNPLTGATVIVTVAESPALTVTVVVLAVMVKSVMLNGSQALVAALLFASPL
jgi:hypothetical protein